MGLYYDVLDRDGVCCDWLVYRLGKWAVRLGTVYWDRKALSTTSPTTISSHSLRKSTTTASKLNCRAYVTTSSWKRAPWLSVS